MIRNTMQRTDPFMYDELLTLVPNIFRAFSGQFIAYVALWGVLAICQVQKNIKPVEAVALITTFLWSMLMAVKVYT